MNILHSTLSSWRDKLAPISHNSTFRSSGQITPEEFVLAGDYLVYKFPTWSWADASSPSKRVSYLPPGKQFLVTRGVPCHRRLNDNFAGAAGLDEAVVQDGLAGSGGADGDDEGWLRTGGGQDAGVPQEAKMRDVRTMDDSGNVGEKDDEEDGEDEIPDMEDEEDDEEAIIRDPKGTGGAGGTNTPLRTYTVYITYTPYYRTPRLYLSGYLSPSEPLPPHLMMEDIVGDYKDKTVTLEDFPFLESAAIVKMASVHPCRHASVMKILLDRADAALKIRMRKQREARSRESVQQETPVDETQKVERGLEGLVEDTQRVSLGSGESGGATASNRGFASGVAAAGGNQGDEWEVLQHEPGTTGSADDDAGSDEVAIRVDQYLVVFLKFMASVTPGIEHDFTMGV